MQNAIRRLANLNFSKVQGKWPLSEERCHYSDTIPTPEEFYRKYKSTYQPVVFRNASHAFGDLEKKWDLLYLSKNFGNSTHTVSRQAAIGHSPKHKPSGRGGVLRRSVLRDSRSLLNRVVCVRFQMSHFPPQTVHNGATRSNEPRENNTLLYPFKVSDPRQLV